MSLPDRSSTLTLDDPQAAETRMRAALGLTPEHAHPSRPVEQRPSPGRNNEASVTVVGARRASEVSAGLRARLVAIESELKAERGERVAAQQALADAQRAIQQLQTKLAHLEMAATEALEAEQKARLVAETRFLDAEPVASPRLAEKSAAPKRRGRPPGKRQVVPADMPEPEPVEWWLPSYKANAKHTRLKS